MVFWKGVTNRVETPGMSTKLWMCITPSEVLIADLWLTQEGVKFEGIVEGESFSGDHIPHVVRLQRELYLQDGHHRIIRTLIEGQRTALVRVLDL